MNLSQRGDSNIFVVHVKILVIIFIKDYKKKNYDKLKQPNYMKLVNNTYNELLFIFPVFIKAKIFPKISI